MENKTNKATKAVHKNKFTHAVNKQSKKFDKNNKARGANGMKAKKSTLNACLDFYAAMGALRGNSAEAIRLFDLAFAENRIVAMQLLFMLRDVRTGMGERQLFRDIMAHLEMKSSSIVQDTMKFIPHYGRYDDLLIFQKTSSRLKAFRIWGEALKNPETQVLAAKWCPRPSRIKTKEIATFVKGFWTTMGLTSEKEYRLMISKLSNTVEQKMCQKEYRLIDYSTVPSLAMRKYNKAFKRNDASNFSDYLSKLVKATSGDDVDTSQVKVNANTLYPYHIVNESFFRNADSKDIMLAEATWKSLPDFMPKDKDGNKMPMNVLPVIDVSGSMTWANVHQTEQTMKDVAISLGMYLANKNTGDWKDIVCSFSDNPAFTSVAGLETKDAYKKIDKMNWSGSTNLEKTMKEIVKFGQEHNVPKKDMPKMIIIFSDMNFNEGVEKDWSAYKMTKEVFANSGYNVPTVVFWNLNHNGTFAVKSNAEGAILTSGFSPSTLKDVFANLNKLNPINIMLNAVNRYQDVADKIKEKQQERREKTKKVKSKKPFAPKKPFVKKSYDNNK